MGRLDEALNLTTASLALDPLDVGGYYWLSTVQLRRGRLADAEAAIRRALDFGPHFSLRSIRTRRGTSRPQPTSSGLGGNC